VIGRLHHVELWVPDLARAARSWGWLLGELVAAAPAFGWTLLFTDRHPTPVGRSTTPATSPTRTGSRRS
jgi:catechol 2,3-dioxygenase-like lactoylglutathione lyase family enzyme